MRDLTDAGLRALKPPATGRTEIRDPRVKGLVLRLTPNGAASWSVRVRTREGKHTRPTLGTWPAMSIADARRSALAMIVAVQSGGDPVAEKKSARAERKEREAAPTVAERMAEWRKAKAASWSARYAAEVERLCIREIEPKLGRRPLRETSRADWSGLIAAKHRRAPGVGAMLYRTAAAFLNFAEAHGWIDLPLLPRKGAQVIAPPVAARDRVLSDDELAAIWKAADREPPKLRAFVRLLALTAARELEVADIETGEVDLATGRWCLPAERTKNRNSITLPLGPLALSELRAVWPNEEIGEGYYLLGRTGRSGFRGFSRLKDRLDAAAGVSGWRWHDLRRSARTGLARLGVSTEVAELCLNHISGRSALVRTYDLHRYEAEIIDALTRWQSHVAALIGEGR
jgi:integrase